MYPTGGADQFVDCTPGDIIHLTKPDGSELELTVGITERDTIIATDADRTNYKLFYESYNKNGIITLATDGKTIRKREETFTDVENNPITVQVSDSGIRLESFDRIPNTPKLG